jgi:hypothetical protein
MHLSPFCLLFFRNCLAQRPVRGGGRGHPPKRAESAGRMAYRSGPAHRPGRHSPAFKTCEWLLIQTRVSGVSVSCRPAVSADDLTGSRAVRAKVRASPAEPSDNNEKQSRNQTDWSAPPAGMVVAVYKNITGALHGSVRHPLKGRRSTALPAKDCENLILAADHAIRIGKPLNRMLTVHFDAAGISNPVKATGQLLKLMGDWLRCNNTALTAVWVREAGSAKGEHVHILLSVPPPI